MEPITSSLAEQYNDARDGLLPLAKKSMSLAEELIGTDPATAAQLLSASAHALACWRAGKVPGL